MVNWGLPSRRVCQVPRHKQVIFKSDAVRFGLCRLKAMDVPETSGWSKLHPLQSWPLESNCETGLPGKHPFCPVPQLRVFFCQVLFWWSQGARVQVEGPSWASNLPRPQALRGLQGQPAPGAHGPWEEGAADLHQRRLHPRLA